MLSFQKQWVTEPGTTGFRLVGEPSKLQSAPSWTMKLSWKGTPSEVVVSGGEPSPKFQV